VAALGAVFIGVRAFEAAGQLAAGHLPSASNFWALYYLLTAVHALHVLGGVGAAVSLSWSDPRRAAGGDEQFFERAAAGARYWHFVGLVWLCLFVALYLL
jgi:nitric oxide reductase NorE protein